MWGISCKHSLSRRFFGVIPLRMTHTFLAFRIRQRRSRSPIKRGADFRTSLAFYGFSSSVIPDFVIPSEGASPTRNLYVIPNPPQTVWGISYNDAHLARDSSFRLRCIQNDSNVISNARERSHTITLAWREILHFTAFRSEWQSSVILNDHEVSQTIWF